MSSRAPLTLQQKIIKMSAKDTICRVCLQEGSIPIYGNDFLDDVSEDLNSIANIKVTADDTFPKHLCYNCYSLLESAMQLRKTAMHSEAVLQGHIVTNLSAVPSKAIMWFNTKQENSLEDDCTESTTDENEINIKLEEIPESTNPVLARNLIDRKANLNASKDAKEDIVEKKICLSDDKKISNKKTVTIKRLQLPKPKKSLNEMLTTELKTKDVDLIKSKMNQLKSKKTYQCIYCSITFTKRIKYREHMKSKEHKISVRNSLKAQETYECTHCNVTLTGILKYKEHLKSDEHQKKRPRESCPVCGKLLFSMNMKRHVQSHADNRPKEPCPICGKSYTSDYMKVHLQFHNKDKTSYVCAICGKGFNAYVNYYIHQKAHSMRTENFKYKCSQCSYSHWKNAYVRRHERIHTEQEKPFKCTKCEKSFTLKCNFNRHMLSHEEPKFSCDMCEKRYTNQVGLKNHIKIVHLGGIRDQICETCGAGFITRREMLKHERRVHKRELYPMGRRPCYLTPKYQSEESTENKVQIKSTEESST